MKKLILALGLLSIAGTTLAAGKPCDELEREIKDKLESKGVHGYSLQILDRATGEKGADGKVVATCEAGTKVITYKRK
ncbi:Protein of unknown function (DUF1161) [Pseudomonas asplenii]|uniref:DUF1161 domain-containing protein n=1 Tax=Pseudomonas asplenii TaxID=53407 RepID=A0A0M9GFB0_9PSED|nr:DUF1161 domain-containing protein [Pseudomonas fuscovaginae]KPA89744.1 Protein of unknown function (DUF1161) [Pseudomonas fuscovaginae]